MDYDRRLLIEIDKLISTCNLYDSIYIYGAAEKQELIARYMSMCDINIKGLVVSKDNGSALVYNEYPKVLFHQISPNSTDNVAVILGLSEIHYNDILPSIVKKGLNIIFLSEGLKNTIEYRLRPRKANEMGIEILVADHCNLNCQMCDHFSQLAKEKLLDINIFEKDMKRLAELTNGVMGDIRLLGGEPLLHPKLKEFFRLAREYFNNANIMLYTNGLMLLQPSIDEVWKACKKYNISIEITQYPININIEKIKERAKIEDVNVNIFTLARDQSYIGKKFSVKYTLDKDGTQPKYRCIYCYKMNQCSTLSYGKVYLCSMPSCINHFNSFFGETFAIKQQDYLDIHKIQKFEEISNFISNPVPFCSYCDIFNREFHPWCQTKKSINEYL